MWSIDRASSWPAAWQFALGAAALAAVTLAAYHLGADALTAALVYLCVVVLTSLWASRAASLLVCVVSILCLDYFFTPPLFTLGLKQAVDDVALLAFSTTGLSMALLITQLSAGARRSFQEIQAREARLREQAGLLDLTHDSIMVRDTSNVLTYWNRGAEALYGWTPKEAVGTVTHVLLRTVFPIPLEEIKAVLLGAGRWEGELVHTRKDGTQVTVASRWAVQRDESGRPVGFLETNNDISERKRAEEAVRKAQAELAHVARVTTLGEMAASIAHEVDQPLSGVVINANASLRFLTGPFQNLDEVRDGLQAIARDGRRASDVIGRIRALARRSTTEKGPLNINEVVREVVALAEGEARRSRATLRTELGADLPHIVGDRVQLQQVVLNLLLNGLDAMHAVVDRPRDLVITTGREGIEQVHVAVRDSGSGIDPQFAHRLFDAFYTTKPNGMGMGLSISRSIVEQHGGRLWAEPNDSPGTTFHFTV